MSDEGTEPVPTENPAPAAPGWLVRLVQVFYYAAGVASVIVAAIAAGWVAHFLARLFMLGWSG